jgi:hypothetical protein
LVLRGLECDAAGAVEHAELQLKRAHEILAHKLHARIIQYALPRGTFSPGAGAAASSSSKQQQEQQ